MNKRTMVLGILCFAYFMFEFGRAYQERENLLMFEERLSKCITTDFQYIPSDYCLYGHSGYEVR